MTSVIIHHPHTFKQNQIGSDELITCKVGHQRFLGKLVTTHIQRQVVESKVLKIVRIFTHNTWYWTLSPPPDIFEAVL